MYIIISHDVDHLFRRDHWFRDLIYPKLWVRSTLQLLRKEITVKEWWLRCISAFQKKRNYIEEVIQFDRENGVPSTFFFGMNQGLGLSYKPEEVKDIILNTKNAGFDVGVHGINYETKTGINEEHTCFCNTVGFQPDGIRMHYVRYTEQTFDFEAQAGYLFDSTEFCKETKGTRKDPYRIGNMWEFPLTIMDGYLPGKLEEMKQATIQLLEECEKKQIEYATILFHDCYFCNAYRDLFKWYKWLIEYLKKHYVFVSFLEAIRQLENNKE